MTIVFFFYPILNFEYICRSKCIVLEDLSAIYRICNNVSFGKKRFMKIIKVCVFLTSIFSTDEWSDFWSSFTESLEPDDEKKKRNELDDSWSAGKWKVSIFVHHLSFLCLLVYHLISSIILWWEFRNHVQHNWFLFFFFFKSQKCILKLSHYFLF